MTYPPWTVLHIPHDSTVIPPGVRGQFVLDDVKLACELARMTDHHTFALFADLESYAQTVRAPVSRLVVDTERFSIDVDEPMAGRGMGCVYTVTADLSPLRRPLSTGERDDLIQAYYIPHHARLEAAVADCIHRYGRCLVLDCHSFPDAALPYELAAVSSARPDICIGTDGFHTTAGLASSFVNEFKRAGLTVGVNDPFAGAMVPGSRYRRDRRVSAVMVEVNRDLYMHETGSGLLPDFSRVARLIKQCCAVAIEAWQSCCGHTEWPEMCDQIESGRAVD